MKRRRDHLKSLRVVREHFVLGLCLNISLLAI